MKILAARGLTLVETMIALTLGLLLMLALTALVSNSHRSYQDSQRFVGLESDLSFISDSLQVDLRSATNIVVAANSLVITNPVGLVTYRRDADNQLFRQENANPEALVAEDVSLFNLRCVDASLATANCATAVGLENTIQVTSTSSGSSLDHRIVFNVALRNRVLDAKFLASGGA